MAASFSAPIISATFGFQFKPDNPALPTQIAVSDSTQITVNPGASAFDGGFTITGTVTNGAPVTIDLSSSTMLGTAFSIDRIIAIKITNTGTAGVISHGGGSSPIYATQPLGIGPNNDFFAHSLVSNPLSVNGVYGHNLLLSVDTGSTTYVVTLETRSA